MRAIFPPASTITLTRFAHEVERNSKVANAETPGG
jgi:hypothetical protein